MDKDEFTGNSISAYFFLEELIDRGVEKRKPSETDPSPDAVESECCEGELFEDCLFEEEFFE